VNCSACDHLGALHLRAADFGGGIDAGQVLAHQARLGAPGTDALHGKGLARAHGQRQRAAQHLPPPSPAEPSISITFIFLFIHSLPPKRATASRR
jgi:hypothetical protein